MIVFIIFFAQSYYKNNIKYPVRFVGYFYPVYGETSKFIESEPLKTIEDCRDWAEDQADNYGGSGYSNYDYECGKDCYKGDPYGGGVIHTCKTSVD